MFRRKASTPQHEWRDRFDRARTLIVAQAPPPWILERLDSLDRLLVDAETDHARLGTSIAQLDLDRATRELKDALRSQATNPSLDSQHLVDALQARYETIHDLTNKQMSIRRGIARALVDVDLLAARSIDLGGRSERWQVDDTVERLNIDLTALRQARQELADL